MPTVSYDLKSKRHYNIIVAGGGVAGCAAAVQAAEMGMSVLIIEKKCTLGGLATGGLVNFMEPLCDGKGKQIIRGYAERWTRELVELGFNTIPEHWKNPDETDKTGRRYATCFSAAGFALLLTNELSHCGADILFDCSVTDVVMENNVCRGVVIYGKAGMEYYECDVLIDTTGDCDALRQAGVPTVKGKNYFTYYGYSICLENLANAVEENDIRLAYSSFGGGGANLYGGNQPEGVPMWSGLSPEDVTEYLKMNHAIQLEKFRQKKGNEFDVCVLPDMPQFRTTCHIKGNYTFTEKDEFRHFDDSVCAVNDFDRKGPLYEIPLRCLTNEAYPNVITAGRSVCADGYGWDIVRVIPPAIITGQVSAIASALSIKNGTPVYGGNIRMLRNEIEKNNIMVHI